LQSKPPRFGPRTGAGNDSLFGGFVLVNGLVPFVSLIYLNPMGYFAVETPVGSLTIVSGRKGIKLLSFGRMIPPDIPLDEAGNVPVTDQLKEYFNGSRRNFDLLLDLEGTPFQQSVWQAVLDIPYGATRSYGEIARAIGKPRAARAVGMASHNNPVSIVVPCHRVIGHDRRLVGYGGGLGIKTALLNLEGMSTSKEPKVTHTRGRLTGSQPILFS
jgi:methylated-DNA-[protein]-cysteine S-methyltransferase